LKSTLTDRVVAILLAVLLISLAGLACNRKENAATGTAATETIAPAKPQPVPTDSGDLTQTVDIEDSRSEAEGGVLTKPGAATETTATTATTTTSTATTTTTR